MPINLARTIRYLKESIPQGENENPESTWIQVRLDVVQRVIAELEQPDEAVASIQN
jgi:hypothetical protein